MEVNIAILASGTGSNARKIVEYFQNSFDINVKLICSNKGDAKVLQLCDQYDISRFVFDKQFFYNTTNLLEVLKAENIEFVVLAGFLWMIPSYLTVTYKDKILNIHPALLPKYGGKGMYGHFVHEAVKAAGDLESGMTVHLVNEEYDKGKVIFQRKCTLSELDDPDTIAQKVLTLEHDFYPRVIEDYIATF